jgi:hypothetical protein
MDDDFVFKSRPQEKDTKCETFLNEKYATRKAKDPNVEIPTRIHLHEVKASQTTKTSIANISWGFENHQNLIGVTIRSVTQNAN